MDILSTVGVVLCLLYQKVKPSIRAERLLYSVLIEPFFFFLIIFGEWHNIIKHILILITVYLFSQVLRRLPFLLG